MSHINLHRIDSCGKLQRASERTRDREGQETMATKSSVCRDMEPILLGVLFLISTSLACLKEQGINSSCHLHLEHNSEWTLTCEFGANIQQTKTNFNVYRIGYHGYPELIAEGYWNEQNKNPHVYSADGYHHDKTYNNTVVIKITPKANTKNGKIFLCMIQNGLIERAKTCHISKTKEEFNNQHSTTQQLRTNRGFDLDVGGRILQLHIAALGLLYGYFMT